MIVFPSDFQGELSIGQVNHDDVAVRVQLFIDKYEPLYLAAAIGAELAKQLMYELQVETPLDMWIKLKELVKQPCACYIYWHIQKDGFSVSAGVGDVVPEADNATRTSAAGKMIRAWNEMVEISTRMRCRIDKSIYPDYAPEYCHEIFRYTNTFGI